jgi:RNA polymerase sigma factor (sigma-70 family)
MVHRAILRRVSAAAAAVISLGSLSPVVALITCQCQTTYTRRPQSVSTSSVQSSIDGEGTALHAVSATVVKKKSEYRNSSASKIEIIHMTGRNSSSKTCRTAKKNIYLLQDGDDESASALALKRSSRTISLNSSSSSSIYSRKTSTLPLTSSRTINSRRIGKQPTKPTAADRLVSQYILKIRALRKVLNAREEYTVLHDIAPPTDSEWATSAINPPIPVAELRRIIQEGRAAQESLLSVNEGLVVQISKRYQSKELLGSALTLQDMIQEGKMGVLEAAERFIPEKGYKFSTYAVFWIRQRILRCLADHSRAIRLPIHVQTILAKIHKAKEQMALEIGRPPSIPELAHRMNLPVERLKRYTESSRKILSLEGPMNQNGIGRLGGLKADDRVLNDWIACDYPTPQDCAEVDCLKQNIRSALEGLPERERNVLLLRFGLDDGSPKAAEEVAKRLRITKDRVRLIEARALNKLRHPCRNYKLKDYISTVQKDQIELDDLPFRKSPFGTFENRWSFL